MTIYLDFDGTVVEHEYPQIGRYVPNSLKVVERLQQHGHQIILNTYRADCNDGTLEMAIRYIETHRETPIKLDGTTATKKSPLHWDPKGHGTSIYIDDQAFGMPTLSSFSPNRNVRVDWDKVEQQLEQAGILTKKEAEVNG